MPPASSPYQTLHAGDAAWDDLGAPEGAPPRGCDPGGGAWLGYGHLYCFDVVETASYRVELAPFFDGALQILERDRQDGWYFPIARREVSAGRTGALRVALDPGRYQVIVSGRRWDRLGVYRLGVDRDASVEALIGREDPARVAALVASAGVIELGRRGLGVYRSSAGGARTSCGLVGGDAVQRLRLTHPERVRLRVAAHFPPAIEVRGAKGGRPFGCARAREGKAYAELTVDLPAGEHVVVVDSLEIRRHFRHFAASGIVTGAYIVDTRIVMEDR